jgi:hypothetical protein
MVSVDREFAARLERACMARGIEYAQAWAKLYPGSGFAIEPLAGGSLIYAGRDAPANRTMGIGFERPVDNRDLAVVARFYTACGVDPRVELCPLADLSLLQGLQRNRYRLEGFFNVFFLPLEAAETGRRTPLSTTVDEGRRMFSNLSFHPVDPPPAGQGWASRDGAVTITPVGEDQKNLWLETVAGGFSSQAVTPAQMLKIISPTLYGPATRCFLAWIDGRAVGGAALLIHDGIAELASGSTLPKFRDRGVHTALMYARQDAARQAGCDLAVIIGTPGSTSLRNAERAGYRLAYTKALMVQERRKTRTAVS